MELYELFGFLIILKESIKLLPKNGKLMALIAIFSVISSSILFLLFNHYLKSLLRDLNVTFQQSLIPDPTFFDMPDPNSSNLDFPSTFAANTGFIPTQITSKLGHLRENFSLFLGVQIAYYLLLSTIYFFSSVATISVTSMSYSGKTLSLKDLVSSIRKTWARPLITSLYISILGTGYFISIMILAAPLLIYPNLTTISAAILLGLMSLIFHLYLLSVWTLGVVISVVEESCYGMAALGKAAAVAKGKRLHGFLLTLLFSIVILIDFLRWNKQILSHEMLVNQILSLLFFACVVQLLKIFHVTGFTVLYFQCKKHHGEEIELHGIPQYTKLRTTDLANDMP